MHDNFKEKHPDIKYSYESYRKLFNSEFNVRFGHCRKDTCSDCDRLRIEIDCCLLKLHDDNFGAEEKEKIGKEKTVLKMEHKVHVARARIFYER